MRHTVRRVAGVLLAILAVRAAAQEPAMHEIPIDNPGFEAAGNDSLPAGWEKRHVGIPAQVKLDDGEKHSGRQSVRMHATEMARTNVLSSPFPVAPGETIHASVWVKCKDVPPDQGKIMMVGQWTDAKGGHEQASRIEIADVGKAEWQEVKGTSVVPPGAAMMRIRLGFVYSQGTIWWDDLNVHAAKPLVARLGLSGARLSPLSGTVPAVIVNRAKKTGPVRLRVALGEKDDGPATDVKLNGELEQSIDVPLKLARRGRQIPLRVALLPADGAEPLFKDERKVNVPPPIAVVPLIPTHWAVEDGVPKIEGEAELAVSQSQLDGATLEAKLIDGAGKVHASWKSDPAHAPRDFVNAFSLAPEAPLSIGQYKVLCTLRPKNGQPVTAEQPFGVIHRRQAKTTLNADGYPVHDGQTIFPLGIFNGGARVKELGEAGFTVQHAYNAVNVELGERPNDQAAMDFLENAQKNGLKCLFLIPRGLVFGGDWEGLRRRVRMFKNHPALLAWDEEEGIARGDMPLESLVKLRRIIQEEDPHHPLMVGDSRDVISRMTDRTNFFPVDQMDLGMWWWYPFPLGQGRDSGLEGEERSKDLELIPPSFLTLAKTDKPIWVGVQAYKKPQPWARFPTPQEYRAQAYLAIIHGARGLMWYGGSVTGGIYQRAEEGHWDEVKQLVREMRGMSDVFMSQTLEPPTIEPADAKVSVMLKRTGERTVLMAVNRTPAAIDVTFALPKEVRSQATVLAEDRSVTPSNDGRLTDRFLPYAVHVYEWRN